jgi:16S rRNA (cytosine967-C5)-methyltransferase
LLAHAAINVKPGGKLIYSVCTLTRPETEGVVQAFNERQPAFEPQALPADILAKVNSRARTSAAAITIWPQDLGGNGMFVAAWRRKN